MDKSNGYKNYLTGVARGFVLIAAAALAAVPAFAAKGQETGHSGRSREARAAAHAEIGRAHV